MNLVTYTIYYSDPPQIGLTFKPTPNLTVQELRDLIWTLQQAEALMGT